MRHRIQLPALPFILMASVLSACGPPSADEIQAESAPTLVAATNARAWDYVSIGGDFTYTQGWDEVFALHLEEDLGVEIRFQDLSTHDNIRFNRWLERIQDDEALRRAIEDAEVLTFDLQDAAYLARPTTMFESGFCGGDDGKKCLREAMAELESDLDIFLDELVRLAHPSETLVYTFDQGTLIPYMPINVGVESQLPTLTEEQTRVWADFELESYRLLRQAAEARGIKVIDIAATFQPDGPYTLPPSDEYFLMLGFSAEGEAVIADLLRQAGYAYR